MASPSDNGSAAPSGATPPLVLQHMAEALALEQLAEALIPHPLRTSIEDIHRQAMHDWVATFGSLHDRQEGLRYVQFMQELAGRLATLALDPTTELLGHARDAVAMGVRQGTAEAGFAGPVSTQLSGDAYQVAAHARDVVAQRLANAVNAANAATSGTFASVEQAITPARQAANAAAAAARTIVNEQINQGIEAAAEAAGAYKMWVAEPDACVTCLALSGTVVGTGEQFPVSRTFGQHTIKWVPDDGLDGPPRHPACRCRLTPWLGSAVEGFNLPDALKREAERSVLLGRGPDSESENVKRTAASKLLAKLKDGRSPSGWQVPKSVTRKSRKFAQ